MFCIITPIFDGAFIAVDGLINDLKEQTYKDFKHILVSNGESKLIKKIIDKANDPRFIYLVREVEKTPTLQDVVVNIAKRRNYAIENCVADRYFFFDADLLLLDKGFLEKISEIHDKADIIISKITFKKVDTLPHFPIKKGDIDIANYSFSRKIAEKYKYPTDYDVGNTGIANDWRFYEQIKDESNVMSDIVYAKKDGRNTYRNLSTRFVDERMQGLL